MKTPSRFLVGTVLLSGLAFAVIGCVSSGYVEVSDGYYYGPGYRDPWFRGGTWIDGNRGDGAPHRNGGRDAYISPPRHQSAPRREQASLPRPPVPHLPSPPRLPHP